MDYLDFVRNISSTAVYNRGLKYYKQGLIANYRVNRTEQGTFRISGTVRGNYYYDLTVDLHIAKSGKIYIKSKCTCPYDWGGECKHIVAILIKFFQEDYEKLKMELIKERDFQKLLQLSYDKDENRIVYFIKGFEEDKLVNFKVYLEADPDNTVESIQFIKDCIKEYMLGYEEAIIDLSARDRYILNFLNDNSYSKGREGNSFLLPKTEENFFFLKGIAADGYLYFYDSQNKVKIGEEISPSFVINGNEDMITIALDSSPGIYHAKDDEFIWTLKGNTVHQIADREIFNLPDKIEIPAEKKGQFLFEVIPSLQKKHSLQINDQLKEYRLIRTEPMVKIELDSADNILYLSAEVVIDEQSFQGPEILTIDTDNKEYIRSEEDDKLWYVKNQQPVKDLIDLLEEFEFHVKPGVFFIKEEEDIQEFITNGLLYLKEEWEVSYSESFENIEIKTVELEPQVEIVESDSDDGDQINWFEFKVYYNLGGKSFSRQEITKMIKYNKQGEAYIQLDNSYYFLQENKQEESLQEIMEITDQGQDDNSYKSSYYNILYYRKLIEESGISFQGNRIYNQIDQDISSDSLVKQEKIPMQVETILRNYQKDGYYWLKFLYKYYFGGILADDMGLGKTIQTLTLLKSLQLSKPVLIVCPRTLIYNWGDEIEKFFPDTKYLVYYGTPEEREDMIDDSCNYQIIISSYSIVSRDYQQLNEGFAGFSYCILDEAQHIKNHRTKRARSVKAIRAERKLCLTGTPIENSVEELWSIFDFLMPGYLGTYSLFKKNYLNPIVNDNNKQKLIELKKRVSPFILRRTKVDVLKDLPEKIINFQQVEMTKLQQDAYQFVLDEVRGEVYQAVNEKGFNQSRIHILAALTKLRQICNHPSLVLDKADQMASSGKIDTLLEMVEDAIAGGHKLVVFSQFVKMLKLIRHRFDSSGIVYEYLDGSTHNRIERVNNFNNDQDIKVFLLSLKAGGVGLNLTSADMVIHVDPWWNPMVERQATDRVHRIGQKNKVVVYKMITRGTVEEKMLKLQKRKEEVFNSVIENNDNKTASISWEDIQELLKYNG